jgi:DNA (cytosine-5)-methyltransferase 1
MTLVEEWGDSKPAVIVLENSPFIRMGEGGRWFLELSKAIKSAGYWFRDSNCVELDTFDHTFLPQKRNRLFMVAFSAKKFRNGRIEFPKTNRNGFLKKDLSRYIDFNGKNDDDTYYLNEENRYHKMISDKVTDDKCIYQLRKYRVRPKEPGVCPTLTANMGLGGHNVPFIIDKKGLRKLTEYECLKLQGFPENFVFPEGIIRSKRYVHIGNAVAAPIAELLIKSILEKLKKEL